VVEPPEVVAEEPQPVPAVEAAPEEPVVQADPQLEETAAPVETPTEEPVAVEEPEPAAPVELSEPEPVVTAPEPEPVAEEPAEQPTTVAPVEQTSTEVDGVPVVSVRVRPVPTSEPKSNPADQLPRFGGLGKAVVRPPPGYDPNDPMGSRRRAKEAADASVRTKRTPTPAGQPAQPRWGAGAPPAKAGEDRRDRPRARPKRRPRRAGRVEMLMDDMPPEARRRRRTRRSSGPKKASPQPKALKRRVEVDGDITVAALAHELSVKAAQVIRVLMGMGQAVRINDLVDFETAQLVAGEFDYEVIDVAFNEEEHLIQVQAKAEDENAVSRPPVVTMMGHVDHGKTSLLDYIRKAKVAAGEAGGITQHISAYQLEHDGQLVTFIDTPGHAAFTEMRARGANATDIVILVVAADDGVMPQTIESINHTRAAGVPIVVAVNKCDKKGVKPEVVRQRLMEQELVPEEYGGDTLMVDVSAITGQGISDLLDAVMLQAELLEITANPDRHGEGVVLEARLEKGRGAVASVIIQHGKLKRGDSVVVGSTYGRLRAVTDFRGKKVKVASPSMPVEIMGLNGVPVAGDHFVVVENDKAAKTLAEHRAEQIRSASLTRREKVTLEDLLARAGEGEKVALNLVVKADVQGSLEALKGSLGKLAVEGAELKVLHDAVGAISESDITLASTYGAVVVGFNIRPDPKARRAAERQGVELKTYKVIYELLDDIRAAMVGMLSPVIEEQYEGTAEVRKTFSVPKVGVVAGCYVQDGKIPRNGLARLVRDGVELWEGKLASLKRFKDDVREVQSGFECGIGLEGYNDLKVGDTVQVFRKVEVAAQG